MEQINLVYIDDTPDTTLTRFLDNLNPVFEPEGCRINFEEIVFSEEKDYEYLLKHDFVKSANIIIIDSWLFENKTATQGKFTGEEFKFVLQKFFPYIEVIVISQNQSEEGIHTLPKFSKKIGCDALTYYNSRVLGSIKIAISNVVEYRKIAQTLKVSATWETLLKEKVLDTLSGVQAYDELKKEDIDQLISAFKEIQEIANGGGL